MTDVMIDMAIDAEADTDADVGPPGGFAKCTGLKMPHGC